ncbi:autophagy-related protein 27 [Glomus cerebriforme]|uniref:Autophagy-related protein 27 n=1 Tax=Glomus cerebriforme TaxID=658196 RepID=A0A397SJ54_9GLOM|nr:autophagy-related protein 27 [Glomus cerebriforme]
MWKFTSIFLFAFAILAILALGQTSFAFDCSEFEVDRIKFNLQSLNKTEKITQEEKTPPTITDTEYHINPCAPLTYDNDDDESKKNHCDNNTYICQIKTNYLEGRKDPRIISIKQIAGGELNPELALGPALNNDDMHGHLSMIYHGASYNDEPQQANITFICKKQGDNKITKYNYKENTLFIEWETQAACGEKIPEEDKGMSGFTKFILTLIFIGLCYFGIGAAYKYHAYKAHGWDLLPHLDFWRDVPYLVSDVFKYIVNSFRTGRGGYSRV